MVVEIEILSGREALEFWKREAIERDAPDNRKGFNSFRDEEVITIFGSYEKVFGLEQAKQFINECLETQKALGGKDKITFNRSVLKTLANMAL